MDKFIFKKRQVSGEATCARETPSTSEASSSMEATTTGEPANMSCDDDEAPSFEELVFLKGNLKLLGYDSL